MSHPASTIPPNGALDLEDTSQMAKAHVTMALEDIFDDIGHFGRFQILMIVCVYTMKFMIGWSMMQMSFAGLIPDYYCVINQPGKVDWTGMGNNSEQITDHLFSNHSLNACSINGSSCDEYKFLGPSRTAITEWNLICDLKWIKAAVTSSQMSGVLVGAVIAGQCGDHFGRKKTTYGFYLFHMIFNLIAAFSVSWQMFAIVRFFIGLGIGAVLVVVVPYPAEFLPLRWRPIIPVIPMWPLGVGFFAGVAWFLEDWSHLHLANAAFCAIGLLGYFYIPESVRWLTVKGCTKEALSVIEKMANFNGKPLPPYTMETIQRIASDEKTSRVGGQKYSYIDAFRGKGMAKTSLIFAFKWASLSIVFYGLSFGVASLAGNIYLNIFLMGIIEIPANMSTFFLTNRLGRRVTCIGFLAIGCVAAIGCLVAHLHAPEDQKGAIISGLSLTAKMAVGACWVASQVWVVESYPTVTRSIGYGLANTAARVGGIIAPFAVNLDDLIVLSYIIIAALLFICAILSWFIPETKNVALPESLHNLELDPQVSPTSNLMFNDSTKGSYSTVPRSDSDSSPESADAEMANTMIKP